MSPAEFLKEVRKGKQFDIVALGGSEEFLLRAALTEYLEKILTPDAAAFDYTEFRGTDPEPVTLWNALTTLPLISERRVVLWEISGEVNKDTLDALARYVPRPSSKTSLILDLSDASRDVRLANALTSSHVTDVEFRDLREPDRAAWAERYVERQGKKIGEEAVRYVVETSGRSLNELAAKLNHAVLYVGEAQEITVQVLMRVAGVTSEYTVWDLEDALIAGKPALAHRIARSLIDGGAKVIQLIPLHRSLVLKLWRCSGALKKPAHWERTEEAERIYAEIFGRQGFKKDSYKRVARQWGEERLREAVIGLVEVEVRAKSESQDPYYYYEWLWKFAA